jgi:hypothetical protein
LYTSDRAPIKTSQPDIVSNGLLQIFELHAKYKAALATNVAYQEEKHWAVDVFIRTK